MSERPRDIVWDALEEHFGPVRTKDERSRRNAAVKQLKEAEATPEEIGVAFAYCERTFTHFTEMALCSWFSRALKESEGRSNVRELFRRVSGE